MIALHAEPIRNNLAKLIGWYDEKTERFFTVNFVPSEPALDVRGRHQSFRLNRSHGERIKAAERLGFTVSA